MRDGIRYLFLFLVIGQTFWCVFEEYLLDRDDVVGTSLFRFQSRLARLRNETHLRMIRTVVVGSAATSGKMGKEESQQAAALSASAHEVDAQDDDEYTSDYNETSFSSGDDGQELPPELLKLLKDLEAKGEINVSRGGLSDVEEDLLDYVTPDDDLAEKKEWEQAHPGQIDLRLNLFEDLDEEGAADGNGTRIVVYEDDLVIRRPRSRPILIPEYKLCFFHVAKVASTTFIMMFQRLLNITDQEALEHLHHPYTNGLDYFHPRRLARANKIIQDPTWTKAIFVRNPHERLLSAYLDKGYSDFAWIRWSCCPDTQDCLRDGEHSFEDFVELLPRCSDVHWVPQYKRMEPKYWRYINFVGHLENLTQDSERLLKRIGAWDNYTAVTLKASNRTAIIDDGRNGSASGGNGTAQHDAPFFDPHGQHHATNARKTNMRKYFTSRELYDKVSEYYKDDYGNPILGLEKKPYEEIS